MPAAFTGTFTGFTLSCSSRMAATILLISAWPNSQSVGNGVFGNFQRARFDHHDGFVGAGDDDVKRAGLLLGNGGIHDQLAFEQSDAHAAIGRGKRNLGNVERGGSGRHADDVRIVFAIGGKHHRDDLRLVGPAFREQRAQRAIGQARGQNFLLRGASFALEESTRNFSRRIGVFAVVHGERQKIFFGRPCYPCRQWPIPPYRHNAPPRRRALAEPSCPSRRSGFARRLPN